MDDDFDDYLINFHVYLQESNRTPSLTDKAEIVDRQEMLSEIMEAAREYYDHVNAYDYQQFRKELLERGIRFTPVHYSATKAKWTKLFAQSVSKEERKRVHVEQHQWHLFSFELLDALIEDAARKAFDCCPKDTVYLFFQRRKEAYLVENAHLLKAEDLDHRFLPDPDIYLFSAEGKWTYIHTHEPNCGPYFYKCA